jgi:hypothetical protein
VGMSNICFEEVSIKGKFVSLPAIYVGDFTVVVLGKWLKKAMIKNEEWLKNSNEIDPALIIEEIKNSSLKADIFTFSQTLPDIKPKYPYYFELRNVAAIPITNFSDWWENLPQVTRKNVRRAEKRGIVVKKLIFNDDLIYNIMKINNSSPVRQNKKFTHYGKDFVQVKKDYSEFKERSEYLGAFYEDELIGFLRLVYRNKITSIMQLLVMPQHYDKRPANALIAKAVELCADNGYKFLTYGQLIYNENIWSSLTEFKIRNGFKKINVPVYYVPLTYKGRIAILLNMHAGITRFLPKFLKRSYFLMRHLYHNIKKREG